MFDNFSVVLASPKYDGNIGAVARIMKNFGFRNLVLINPPTMGKEARAMAVHAYDIIENAVILEKFENLKDRFDFLVGTTAVIAGDGNTLRTPVKPDTLKNSLDLDAKIALVFGREDDGLLNDEIEMCDLLITIPTSIEYPTLNLAQSVCIILYEISKQEMLNKFSKRKKKLKEFDKIEKKVLLEKYDALVDSIYDHDFENNLSKKTFRQLIGRAFISGREAFTLIGLFRRAGEKKFKK